MAKAWIPCPHDHYNTLLSPSSSRPKLEVRLIYEEVERLIFDNVPGSNEPLIIPNLATATRIISEPMNPFCRRCEDDFVATLTSQGIPTSCFNNLWKGIQDGVGNNYREVLDTDHVSYHILRTYHDTRMDYSYDYEVLRALESSFEEHAEAVRPTPANETSIEVLKRSIIMDNENTTCVICLENMKNMKDEIALKITMPCKHEFHEGCLTEWLHISHVCPLCRFELPQAVKNS